MCPELLDIRPSMLEDIVAVARGWDAPAAALSIAWKKDDLMGVILASADHGSLFELSWREWSLLLDIALEHGWHPEGTALPEFEGWEGSYLANEGQRISANDGQAMAAALRRALECRPETGCLEAKLIGTGNARGQPIALDNLIQALIQTLESGAREIL